MVHLHYKKNFGPIGSVVFDKKNGYCYISKKADFKAFIILCKSDQKGTFILQNNFFGPIGSVVFDQNNGY